MAKQTIHPIEAELKKLTGLKRQEGDTNAQWRTKLVRAAAKIDEDEFEVTTETGAWFDSAVMAMNKKKDPPPFNPDTEDDEEVAEEKPPKRRRAALEEEPADDSSDDDAADDDDPDAADDDDTDDEPAPTPAKGKPAKKVDEDNDDEPAPRKAEKPATKSKAPVKSDDDSDDTNDEIDQPKSTKKDKSVPPKVEAPTKVKPSRKPEPAKAAVVDHHRRFRRLVLENPTLERREIYALAAQEGIGLMQTSMSTVIYHVGQTLDLLKEVYGFEIPPKKGKKA